MRKPIDDNFKKSTYSSPGSCVEVKRGEKEIKVRDSKAPDAGLLKFDEGEWKAFILGVKAGEFD